MEVFGDRAELERFVHNVKELAPSAAVIDAIDVCEIEFQATPGFSIETSQDEAAPVQAISIPADMATCDACLAEIHDPSQRRYRYPFTNCTQCGPRFTIATGVPYDRPKTTMMGFPLCADCAKEYTDPQDRRFHAEPIACPICGPHLSLYEAKTGALLAGDPIDQAAWRLIQGEILAVKGIGGFHLACDATSANAVARLRRLKHRWEKPFAVMVADEAQALTVAECSSEERALLRSPIRPIVLLRRRVESVLVAEVCPDNSRVGLFLPYSPLHHLLLEAVGRPLVMTSGNRSEEPIAFTNEDAKTRLTSIADVQLFHDRPIENPCDDSVAQVIAGRPVVIRRSRGYVPTSLSLATPIAHPVLACGGQLKNTFCLAAGDRAFLGPHIGDLDNLETLCAYEEAIDRLSHFTGITPVIIAHDLHPDYLSTRYAMARPEPMKQAVQHHHAHVVSAMAEHGIAGTVIGVAFDGTGLGPDGTAWGGEILRCTPMNYERIATLRPIRLPGGDRAIHEVWRLALALLDDAFGEAASLDGLALFSDALVSQVGPIRSLMHAGLNSPLAHGAGRYFDALGALGLAAARSHFEGQIATRFGLVAEPNEGALYPYLLDESTSPPQIDLRGMVRGFVADLRAGCPVATISARFHNTLVAATIAAIHRFGEPSHPIVLTGGCFQNERLVSLFLQGFQSQRVVYCHGRVPSGDGGLALGQALVAAQYWS
jgi:hydrogenase maturation protein HypF